MLYTRNILGALLKKYRSILKKCHWINVMGSMAFFLWLTPALAADPINLSAVNGIATIDTVKTGSNLVINGETASPTTIEVNKNLSLFGTGNGSAMSNLSDGLAIHMNQSTLTFGVGTDNRGGTLGAQIYLDDGKIVVRGMSGGKNPPVYQITPQGNTDGSITGTGAIQVWKGGHLEANSIGTEEQRLQTVTVQDQSTLQTTKNFWGDTLTLKSKSELSSVSGNINGNNVSLDNSTLTTANGNINADNVSLSNVSTISSSRGDINIGSLTSSTTGSTDNFYNTIQAKDGNVVVSETLNLKSGLTSVIASGDVIFDHGDHVSSGAGELYIKAGGNVSGGSGRFDSASIEALKMNIGGDVTAKSVLAAQLTAQDTSIAQNLTIKGDSVSIFGSAVDYGLLKLTGETNSVGGDLDVSDARVDINNISVSGNAWMSRVEGTFNTLNINDSMNMAGGELSGNTLTASTIEVGDRQYDSKLQVKNLEFSSLQVGKLGSVSTDAISAPNGEITLINGGQLNVGQGNVGESALPLKSFNLMNGSLFQAPESLYASAVTSTGSSPNTLDVKRDLVVSGDILGANSLNIISGNNVSAHSVAVTNLTASTLNASGDVNITGDEKAATSGLLRLTGYDSSIAGTLLMSDATMSVGNVNVGNNASFSHVTGSFDQLHVAQSMVLNNATLTGSDLQAKNLLLTSTPGSTLNVDSLTPGSLAIGKDNTVNTGQIFASHANIILQENGSLKVDKGDMGSQSEPMNNLSLMNGAKLEAPGSIYTDTLHISGPNKNTLHAVENIAVNGDIAGGTLLDLQAGGDISARNISIASLAAKNLHVAQNLIMTETATPGSTNHLLLSGNDSSVGRNLVLSGLSLQMGSMTVGNETWMRHVTGSFNELRAGLLANIDGANLRGALLEADTVTLPGENSTNLYLDNLAFKTLGISNDASVRAGEVSATNATITLANGGALHIETGNAGSLARPMASVHLIENATLETGASIYARELLASGEKSGQVSAGKNIHISGDIMGGSTLQLRAGEAITANNLYAKSLQAQNVLIKNGDFNLAGTEKSIVSNNMTVLGGSDHGIKNGYFNDLSIGNHFYISGSNVNGGNLYAGVAIAASPSQTTTLRINNLEDGSGLAIGKNAYVSIGGESAALMRDILRRRQSGSGVLALDQPIKIGSGGLKIDGSSSNPVPATNTLYFAPQSHLIVNGEKAWQEDYPDGIISAQSAMNATVQDGAKITFDGVAANKTYVVLGKNITTHYQSATAWDDSNIETGAHLVGIRKIAETPGSFRSYAIKATDTYPGLDGSIGDGVDNGSTGKPPASNTPQPAPPNGNLPRPPSFNPDSSGSGSGNGTGNGPGQPGPLPPASNPAGPPSLNPGVSGGGSSSGSGQPTPPVSNPGGPPPFNPGDSGSGSENSSGNGSTQPLPPPPSSNPAGPPSLNPGISGGGTGNGSGNGSGQTRPPVSNPAVPPPFNPGGPGNSPSQNVPPPPAGEMPVPPAPGLDGLPSENIPGEPGANPEAPPPPPGRPVPDIFPDVAVIGTEEKHFNSPVAGIRFLSRLTSVKYMDHDYAGVTKTLESIARIATIGAVPQMTWSANSSAVEAAADRATFQDSALHNQADLNGRSIALWIVPMFRSMVDHELHANNFNYDVNGNLGGVAAGIDWTLGDRLRAGLDFHIGGGYAKSGGDLAKTTNSMGFWGVGLYGGWLHKNFNIAGDVHFTASWNTVEQELPWTLEMKDLKSEITAHAISAGLEAGYAIPLGQWNIVPHVGARHLWLHTDNYSVCSNGAVMDGAAIDQSIWTFPIGSRLQGEFETDNGWKIRPSFDISVIPAAGDLEARTKINFTGLNTDAVIYTQTGDYLRFGGSAGIELSKDNFSLGVNYNVAAGWRTTDQSVFGMLRYEF